MQHRITRMFTILLLSFVVLSLAACGNSNKTEVKAEQESTTESKTDAPQEGTSSKIVIEHKLGKVELDKTPERVVVLEFSYTDALMTLGVQPVGIADDDDKTLFMDVVKDQLKDYTSIGSRYEPNIEVLSSLQPDLIIADLNHHKALYEQLNAIAPTIVLNDHLAGYPEMLDNYMVIAKAVGKEAEGKKRLEEHTAKIEAAKAKMNTADIQILPAVTNPKGFFAQSDHSYLGTFLSTLGIDNPVKNEDSYPQLSLEQLSEANPKSIFLLPATEETIVQTWESNPLWTKLDAVKNKQVYTVERKNWVLSRGLLGSERIAEDLVTYLGAK